MSDHHWSYWHIGEGFSDHQRILTGKRGARGSVRTKSVEPFGAMSKRVKEGVLHLDINAGHDPALMRSFRIAKCLMVYLIFGVTVER